MHNMHSFVVSIPNGKLEEGKDMEDNLMCSAATLCEVLKIVSL